MKQSRGVRVVVFVSNGQVRDVLTDDPNALVGDPPAQVLVVDETALRYATRARIDTEGVMLPGPDGETLYAVTRRWTAPDVTSGASLGQLSRIAHMFRAHEAKHGK